MNVQFNIICKEFGKNTRWKNISQLLEQTMNFIFISGTKTRSKEKNEKENKKYSTKLYILK